MIYRDLGRTGLKVSEIGLGTEHLGRTSKAKENVTCVVDRAVENGINYFDLIFAEPSLRAIPSRSSTETVKRAP